MPLLSLSSINTDGVVGSIMYRTSMVPTLQTKRGLAVCMRPCCLGLPKQTRNVIINEAHVSINKEDVYGNRLERAQH